MNSAIVVKTRFGEDIRRFSCTIGSFSSFYIFFLLSLVVVPSFGWRFEQMESLPNPSSDSFYGTDISTILSFPNGTLSFCSIDRKGVDILANGHSYHSWSHRFIPLSPPTGLHLVSISMSQSVIVVGASDTLGEVNGTVYASLLSSINFTKLVPPPLPSHFNGSLNGFGSQVASACETETIAASIPFAGVVGTYWFDNSSKLELMKTVYPPANEKPRRFGYSLALTDNNLIIGAPDFDNSLTGNGAVFAYFWDQQLNNWTIQTILSSSDFSATPLFGSTIDINCAGTILAVSSPCSFGASASCTDLVLVFSLQNDESSSSKKALPTWKLLYTLRNPHPELSSAGTFGISLAVADNDMVAIGSPSSTTPGNVYIFKQGNLFGTVNFKKTINGGDEKFGSSIGLIDDILIVGSPRQAINGLECSGALFFFSVSELSALTLAIILSASLFVVIIVVLFILSCYKLHPSSINNIPHH